MNKKNHLTKSKYENQFSGLTEIDGQGNAIPRKLKAFEKAWENRDFEIQLYWKRATYFWAFIISSFTGYIFVKRNGNLLELEYIITCLGYIFSLAFLLVNFGSKKWQENWERHIDMLEEEITGKLYRTVLYQGSFSVSKINILVSYFIMIVWLGLAVNFTYSVFRISTDLKLNWIYLISNIITIIFSAIMLLTYGKTGKSFWGRQKKSKISFFERNVEYRSDNEIEDKNKK